MGNYGNVPKMVLAWVKEEIIGTEITGFVGDKFRE